MALIAEQLANDIKNFIKQSNTEPVKDIDVAIDTYCSNMETAIYNAIKTITITIPTGAIQVQGTSVAQANIVPIILTGTVS